MGFPSVTRYIDRATALAEQVQIMSWYTIDSNVASSLMVYKIGGVTYDVWLEEHRRYIK